jgi:photosystem II stability/assembly factor-like uncharacterized protein
MPLAQGQLPLPASALTVAGNTLLVGSSSGQIAYSRDGGEIWYSGHLRYPVEAVTGLITSPNYEKDGVMLAGTGGTGIQRSTDGGRNWDPASFGLQNFTILALGTVPEWGRREVVFAGTTSGLYRSPNGGRAWKKLDIGDWVFQALAAAGSLVLAGTEGHGVFRSNDGGKRWEAEEMGNEPPAINALWIQPGSGQQVTCLAGTGDGRILRSEDGGKHWNSVTDGPAPIICMGQAGKRLYAGLLDKGVLVSDDGLSWASEPSLPLFLDEARP